MPGSVGLRRDGPRDLYGGLHAWYCEIRNVGGTAELVPNKSRGVTMTHAGGTAPYILTFEGVGSLDEMHVVSTLVEDNPGGHFPHFMSHEINTATRQLSIQVWFVTTGSPADVTADAVDTDQRLCVWLVDTGSTQ